MVIRFVYHSFFDVINKPAESIFEAFLGFGGAGSDGPLPALQNLFSELLQNLARKRSTSSGCSAWTRSCLLAKIRTGTVDNYFY